MRSLNEIKILFKEKLGLKEDMNEGKEIMKTEKLKTKTVHNNNSVPFAYSSKREEFSFPVHSFTINISPNSIVNINSNRLVPLVESCSASFIEGEMNSDKSNTMVINYLGESYDSLNSDDDLHIFDFQVWKNVMEPLEILERIFSKPEKRLFSNSSTSENQQILYVTKIPIELLATTVLNYCSRHLSQLVPSSFSELKSLTTLQLCCNSLTELPQEICLLRRLETLSLSNNKLKSLPSTIGYLINLEALHLDRNKLTTLPRSFSGLKKLKVLSIAANELTEIPRSVMLLTRLVTLECDRNPLLLGVPSEITRFSQLARFHVEECPKLLKESQYEQFSEERSTKGPPSLLESSARSLIRNRKPVLYSLARHLKLFISRSEECSFCSGPMIDSRVIHLRTIKRIDRPFPAIDQMCCAHWTSEEERITKIFSPSPLTTPPLLLCTDRRNRAGQLEPFNQFDPERSARGQRILKKFKTEYLVKVMVPLSLLVDWPQYPIQN